MGDRQVEWNTRLTPIIFIICCHGPLARYVKFWIAHAPGMSGMSFSPPPRVSNPDMHHGTCVTHVPWCMSGSLTSGFLWSRWRGKRYRHSRCMRTPNFPYLARGPYTTTKRAKWRKMRLQYHEPSQVRFTPSFHCCNQISNEIYKIWRYQRRFETSQCLSTMYTINHFQSKWL